MTRHANKWSRVTLGVFVVSLWVGCNGGPKPMAVAEQGSAMKVLAESLARKLPEAHRTVAVAGIYDLQEKRQTELSARLEDELAQALAQHIKFTVLPRRALTETMAEDALFRQPWFLKDADIVKGANLLSVRLIVTGTYFRQENKLLLRVRAIDARTGLVMAIARGEVLVDSWALMEMMTDYPYGAPAVEKAEPAEPSGKKP